jgi:ribosomal protein L16 Arg81 hydroxylase
MKVELSAEELAMDGAPEGELFVAVVLERREVHPADDPAAMLAALLEQLQTKAGLGEWFEKFIFSEKARGVIVHNGSLITSDSALTVGALVRQ